MQSHWAANRNSNSKNGLAAAFLGPTASIQTNGGSVFPPPPLLLPSYLPHASIPAPPPFRCCNNTSTDNMDHANCNNDDYNNMYDSQLQDGSFTAVLPSVCCLYPKRCAPSSPCNFCWRCHSCGGRAYGHRCVTCSKRRDVCALRVFVGQICNECTAEVAVSMIETLCGDELSAPLLHIEPHTHAKTGHGKGCCWLYVNAREDVATIVRRLHKRAFCTICAQTGRVGYRCFGVHTSEEVVASKCRQELSQLPQQARELLQHTSPVTAEVPVALAKAMVVREAGQAVSSAAASAALVVAGPLTCNKCSAPASACYAEEKQPEYSYASKLAVDEPSCNDALQVVVAAASVEKKSAPVPLDDCCCAVPCRRYMWNPYSTTSARVVLLFHPRKNGSTITNIE